MINKNYLITGGTGFLGRALIARLFPDNYNLTVISRNEGKLIELKEKYPTIRILTGSVDNPFEMQQACKGMDGIFHLAAFKHVGIAESLSYECINSNIIGSINVLLESIKNEPEFVIGISTDKAAQVVGVYGATKLIMERLFQQFSETNNKTKYRLVRYGNVLWSTGSVLTKWVDLIKNDKEIILTNPDATRFYWNVEQAINTIFDCLQESINTNPYCPYMKAIRIGDLLEACYLKFGRKGQERKIKTIGLQQGENKHEKILEQGPYSNEVELYSVYEIIEMI